MSELPNSETICTPADAATIVLWARFSAAGVTVQWTRGEGAARPVTQDNVTVERVEVTMAGVAPVRGVVVVDKKGVSNW